MVDNTCTISSFPWTAVISTITLFAAILSPIITTIINNLHQNKIEKMKFYDKHRADVIENYLHYAGYVVKNGTSEAFGKYGEYSKEIYLYVPNELWELIDSIDDNISNANYPPASEKLTILCKALKENPPRTIKKNRHKYN